jgi:hypothetical protein
MEERMKLWELIVVTLSLGGAIAMYAGFIFAWANGSDQIIFQLNNYGEQIIETILFPALTLAALVILLRRIRLARSK